MRECLLFDGNRTNVERIAQRNVRALGDWGLLAGECVGSVRRCEGIVWPVDKKMIQVNINISKSRCA